MLCYKLWRWCFAEAEPEPKKPFQGSSHSLLGGVPADEEGHDPDLDGLGVFAKTPRGSYHDAVEHLQRIQDDAAINALMEKLEGQKAEAEDESPAEGPATSGRNRHTAAGRPELQTNKQKEATQVCAYAQQQVFVTCCDNQETQEVPYSLM